MDASTALGLIDMFLSAERQRALGHAMGGTYFERAVQNARSGHTEAAEKVVGEWASYAKTLGPVEWDQMFLGIKNAAGETVADQLKAIAYSS